MSNRDSDGSTVGEQRPVDFAQEARAKTAEASELAEHIIETDPRWTREEQLKLLVGLIDDAHEAAFSAEVGLNDGE